MIALSAIKGFSVVKVAGLSALGLLAYSIVDQLTHNFPAALAWQGLTTVTAAWLMNRHKVAGVKSAHELSLLDRLHQEREQVMKVLMERLDTQNKLISALTITKHAMANELARRQDYVWRWKMTMGDRGIDLPDFNATDITVLTREEDKIRAAIAGMDPGAVAGLIEGGSAI